jgi:hypothetical protein
MAFKIRMKFPLIPSVCRTFREAVVVLATVLLASPSVVLAQQGPQRDRVRILYEMNDTETREYVRRVLDSGLTGDQADELILLTLNRSALVVPELAARLEAVTATPGASARFVHTLADILAYASNEGALYSLIRLCQTNSSQFGYFVRRTLDYSAGRRNPYSLIYSALSDGQDGCASQFAEWIDVRKQEPINDGIWAEAILKRYAHVPSDAELANDPITARLGVPVPSQVRDKLRNAKDSSPRN